MLVSIGGAAVGQRLRDLPVAQRLRDLLPGEDSNLQPTDYPFPEVSLGRGLSHCLGAFPRYRHWALSL